MCVWCVARAVRLKLSSSVRRPTVIVSLCAHSVSEPVCLGERRSMCVVYLLCSMFHVLAATAAAAAVVAQRIYYNAYSIYIVVFVYSESLTLMIMRWLLCV